MNNHRENLTYHPLLQALVTIILTHIIRNNQYLSFLSKIKFSITSSISSTLFLACFFNVSHKLANSTVPQKTRQEMEIHFFFMSYDSHMCRSRTHAYMYNSSRIQFAWHNDSVDAIEANWKWIQTRSKNSY